MRNVSVTNFATLTRRLETSQLLVFTFLPVSPLMAYADQRGKERKRRNLCNRILRYRYPLHSTTSYNHNHGWCRTMAREAPLSLRNRSQHGWLSKLGLHHLPHGLWASTDQRWQQLLEKIHTEAHAATLRVWSHSVNRCLIEVRLLSKFPEYCCFILQISMSSRSHNLMYCWTISSSCWFDSQVASCASRLAMSTSTIFASLG